MWYANHTIFEYQVNQCLRGCLKWPKASLWMRRILAVAMIGLIFKQFAIDQDFEFLSLTRVAKYFTAVAFICGSLVHNPNMDMIEDLNYIDDDFVRRRYTPFRAWKWYIINF